MGNPARLRCGIGIVHLFIGMIAGFWSSAGETIESQSGQARERLGEVLFKNYNPKLRPVKVPRSVKVFLDMTLYQILEVVKLFIKAYQACENGNSKQQFLLVYVWMTQTWQDDFLYWDPQEFGDNTEIHVPAQDLWRPDTYLQTNIEMDQSNTERFMTAILEPQKTTDKKGINTTWVTMAFPAIYKVACAMNMKYFPWDIQTCPLEFTSWTYDVSKLDYYTTRGSVNLKEYRTNQEYDLLNFTVNRTLFCTNRTHPNKGTHEKELFFYYVMNLLS